MAEITIVGVPIETLKEQIQAIRKWDNGHNFQIKVYVDMKTWAYASIHDVEAAINGDLDAFVNSRFKDVIQSRMQDQLNNIKKKIKKKRNKMLHLTPPKKKRIKRKKQ